MTALPLLGLGLGRRHPETIVPLLVAARRWCLPVAIDSTTGAPAAILATADGAALLPGDVPLALWTPTRESLGSREGERAAAIVSDDWAIADAAGARGVMAASARRAGERRPLPPFVRERLRSARGLPPVALLDQTAGGWRWTGQAEALTDELVPTAMACASAVVAREPARLLEAMAWGAPCVTDPGTADQIGALPLTHLLIASTAPERLALAEQLAADPDLAARLSHAGRSLVERRHDVDIAARRLIALLGLRPGLPDRPMASAELQLGLLATPWDARIGARLAEAVAQVVR